jgi:hypothetical protein
MTVPAKPAARGTGDHWIRAVTASVDRVGPYAVRHRNLWDDPIEGAEDRSLGEAKRQTRGRGDGVRLPLPAQIRAGACVLTTSRRLSRTNQAPHRPHIKRQRCPKGGDGKPWSKEANEDSDRDYQRIRNNMAGDTP